jgi:hypothetical protein
VPGSGLSADASTTAIAVYVAEFVLDLGVVLLAALAWPRWRTSNDGVR